MLRIASSVACVCVTSDSTMMHFSHRMRESLIRVGHRTRSRKIIRPQLDNLKPCSSNKVLNFAIEVAASTDLFPHWSYPIEIGDHLTQCARQQPKILDIKLILDII